MLMGVYTQNKLLTIIYNQRKKTSKNEGLFLIDYRLILL